MARLEIPDNLRKMYRAFHQAVEDAAKSVDKPMMWPFTSEQVGAGPAEFVGNAVAPEKVEDAFIGGILNLMPGYIAANYRTPEAIQGLRKMMAEENKARGEIVTKPAYSKTPGVNEFNNYDEFYDFFANKAGWPPESIPKYWESYLSDIPRKPDPLDQILRGSWFHGMRPEAREALSDASDWGMQFTQGLPSVRMGNDVYRIAEPDIDLSLANYFGLPASTHATPSYTRFGEPYGVSISASPAVAQRFSADDYIHRVMPLYGGPPTERIIPMWRPEGQAAMNEGYNRAFNQVLDIPRLGASMNQYAPRIINPTSNVDKNLVSDLIQGSVGINADMADRLATSQFNTLYSQALQDMGYRGILYSPQRYGEYEMLMLDPSFIKPLDYRRAEEYINPMMGREGQTLVQNFANQGHPGWIENLQATPGSRIGYSAAQPEFEAGASRLTDVFNQMSWVDRINEENKRRIAEMIDAKYREQVMNQLFGGQ